MASANTQFTTTNVNAGAESGADKYAGLENQIGSSANHFANLSAPMATAATGGAAQINTAPADATLGQQNHLIGQLQSQADGTGPSVATGMLKMGTDRTIAQQDGSLASNPGINPALAAHMAATNTINGNQSLAQAAALQKAQDQLNGQTQLGSVLNGVRGQDQNQAFNQAQLNQQAMQANLANQQQVNLANQGATLGVQQNNANNALGFTNALGSTINSDVSGQQFVGQQAVNQSEWQQAQQAEQERANAAGTNALIGGAISGAASIASGGLSGALGAAGKAAGKK